MRAWIFPYPANNAARTVGDRSMSRPVASLRLDARGTVGLELRGAGLDVETAGPHARLGSPFVVAGFGPLSPGSVIKHASRSSGGCFINRSYM
jgi:hypothetical protein